MLPEEKYKELKEELDNCTNPLFIYDDDPDGLCSFLMFYRYKGEGNGVFVKSVPVVGSMFIHHIEKYQPDKIFILDMPNISEEFLHYAKVPVIWVDHHPHDHPNQVKSFNPHDFGNDSNDTSTTGLCYNTVKQDLWIAAIGAIGDWTLPPFLDDFRKEYPDLLKKDITNPPEALFDSPLSPLINMFSMALKGDTKTTKKVIKALTKIKDPIDLLEGNSEEAQFIHRKTKSATDELYRLLERGMAIKPKDGIINFIYDAEKHSFSKEASNYLQYKNPDKVVIVGRKKNGEYKLSIRAQLINIPPILEKSLTGLQGYGGGHDHACGACVNELHFEEFMERFTTGIIEAKKS